MALESGNTYTDIVTNYSGELLSIGNNATPFLQMLGGMGGIRPVTSTQFAMAETYDVGDGAQPAIAESGSITPTAAYVTRAQEFNVVQIFQYAWNISYSKLGETAQYGGINARLPADMIDDERSRQEIALMLRTAKNLEKSIIAGAFADRVDSDTAVKTRGISTAISTLATDASGAALSKTLLQGLWKAYADANSWSDAMVVWVNSFQKQKLNDIYGLAERDMMVGGVNLSQILTDFGPVGVQYSPAVPTDEVMLVDMSVCSIVGKNIPGKGVFFSETLGKTGASEKGQIYGELGIDYGSESKHAKLDDLAVS